MKKLLFITCLTLCICKVKAQNSTAATTADTTKKAAVKSAKTRIVGGTQMSPTNDVIENLSKSKDHTTFIKAINISGLSETLKSKGPLTVFAPTNDAFKKNSRNSIDTLLKSSHNEELTRLITYYVIPGKLSSKDIAKQIAASKGEATFITLSGAKLKAKINADRNIVLVDENSNESIISQFDIEQNNGIVDVVTALLTPKAK